jgi:hypothetical protein
MSETCQHSQGVVTRGDICLNQPPQSPVAVHTQQTIVGVHSAQQQAAMRRDLPTLPEAMRAQHMTVQCPYTTTFTHNARLPQ